jgi:hypothetical protein
MGVANRYRARRLIVKGLLATGVGMLVYFAWSVSHGWSFSGPFVLVELDDLFNPIAVVAAAWAWWWLSGLSFEDGEHRVRLQRAYVGFVVWAAFIALAQVASLAFVVWSVRSPSIDWYWISQAVQTFGAALTFAGFVVLARAAVSSDTVAAA